MLHVKDDAEASGSARPHDGSGKPISDTADAAIYGMFSTSAIDQSIISRRLSPLSNMLCRVDRSAHQ